MADSKGFRDEDTFVVTFEETNDAPEASAGHVDTYEDEPADGFLEGTDVDGTIESYALTEEPTHGDLVLTDSSTGEFFYVPDEHFFGADTFAFTVTDEDGASSEPATVTIEVHSVNDAPVAEPGAAAVEEDNDLTGTLAGADVDGEVAFYQLEANSSKTRTC